MKNESIIRVSDKYESNNEEINSENHSIKAVNNNTINESLNKSQTKPSNECNTSSGTERPVSQSSEDLELNKLKIELNSESCERYLALIKVIKEYSYNNCDLLSDYEWFHVIHYRMVEKGYKNFEPKNWKNCFNYFLDIYIKV